MLGITIPRNKWGSGWLGEMLAELAGAEGSQRQGLTGFARQFRYEAPQRPPHGKRNFVTTVKGLPGHECATVVMEIPQCLARGKRQIRILPPVTDQDRQSRQRFAIVLPFAERDARRREHDEPGNRLARA